MPLGELDARRACWDHRGVADLRDYRRKRDPKKTPEPFGGAPPRSRSSVQRHDARRSITTCGSSGTGPSRAGPSRKGCRSGRASGTSPCTSRTTRSTTRRSRASSRPASTAPGTVEIWDRGHVRAPRGETRAAVSPCVSTASARRGSGRSSRRDSTATSGTGCSSGRTRRSRRRPAASPAARPARRAAAEGQRLALRAEVGRLPGDRHRVRRGGDPHEPQRQRPHRAVPLHRAGGGEGGPHALGGDRRGGVRARRGRVRPASRRSRAAPGGSS